jgi:outer membrane lipoprotein-sorting protein
MICYDRTGYRQKRRDRHNRLEYNYSKPLIKEGMYMGRFRNKSLVVLLLALFMMVLATGCGGGTNETGGSSQTDNQQGNTNNDVDAAALLAKGQGLAGLSYDSVTTVAGMDPFTTKVWVKEGNMRVEMDVPEAGGKMISIVNTSEGAVYSYGDGQEMATKMPLAQSEVDTTTPQDYSKSMNPESMKYIKTETLDGKKCVVYEITDEDYTGKVWLWKDYGIPLRIEATSEGESMAMEYKNVQVTELDDSLFQLPEGVEVMDLGNIDLP